MLVELEVELEEAKEVDVTVEVVEEIRDDVDTVVLAAFPGRAAPGAIEGVDDDDVRTDEEVDDGAAGDGLGDNALPTDELLVELEILEVTRVVKLVEVTEVIVDIERALVVVVVVVEKAVVEVAGVVEVVVVVEVVEAVEVVEVVLIEVVVAVKDEAGWSVVIMEEVPEVEIAEGSEEVGGVEVEVAEGAVVEVTVVVEINVEDTGSCVEVEIPAVSLLDDVDELKPGLVELLIVESVEAEAGLAVEGTEVVEGDSANAVEDTVLVDVERGVLDVVKEVLDEVGELVGVEGEEMTEGLADVVEAEIATLLELATIEAAMEADVVE